MIAGLTAALIAIAAAMLILGASVALSATNATKRMTGAQIALLGAILAAGALGAPQDVLLVGATMSVVLLALGSALVVRLQESYGALEAPELDAADEQSDAGRPS